MKLIERNKSIFEIDGDLEKLICFPNFPVFIGCTDKSIDDDIFLDMEWDICVKSGCIQLKNLLPLSLVYSEYHSEALGNVWKSHHQEFSEFISKNKSNDILEIGGSNGYLAEKVCSKSRDLKWTIVEPNPDKNKVFSEKNIDLVEEFFTSSTSIEKGRDVVHSHVFEHMYDPNEFLDNLSQYLDYGGKQIFSIPNLKSYLDQKFSNVINFEHTFYFNEEMLQYLFYKHGFKIVDKKYFRDHSIFIVAEKTKNFDKLELKNFYVENKQSYLNMVNYYKNLVVKINNIIQKDGEPVFVFGAHIFSQFLIYLGLNQDNVVSILDNSTPKNGKRLYGTKFKIDLPEKIKLYKKPIVIIFAGQYQEEIEQQLLHLNKETIIIGPNSSI